MEEIEVVIKIPQEEYETIVNSEDCGLHTLTRAIAHGTILPKGHGRLIDADKLKDQIIEVKLENVSRDIRVVTGCQLEETPTILEADEGVSEE